MPVAIASKTIIACGSDCHFFRLGGKRRSNSGKIPTIAQAISSLVRARKKRKADFNSSRPITCIGMPRSTAADPIASRIALPPAFLGSFASRRCFVTIHAGEPCRRIGINLCRIQWVRLLQCGGTALAPQSRSCLGPEKSAYPILL